VSFVVHARNHPAAEERPFEVVERKGRGHPDTICDAVAEQVSQALCRYYLEQFGRVLHHNVDKVLLCGGQARSTFGGGEITAPIEIYLAGRATSEVNGKVVPVADIAVAACEQWLSAHLPELDAKRDVRIMSRIRPGSRSLTELFLRGPEVPLANDTSCGVGFAPLSDLERLVLAVEQRLNSAATKAAHPALGSDVKVLGVRRGARIELTVACAIVARHVKDLAAYLAAKEQVLRLAREVAQHTTRLDVRIVVNAEDVPERAEVFLTVSGTSAEAGDDGEVGRGNRANGLITPYRPMTLEATAGKNPVNHVGKLYNLAAQRAAAQLVAALPGARDASCVLVSRIGEPIDRPQAVEIELGLDEPKSVERLIPQAMGLVREELRNLVNLPSLLLGGRLKVW
jgi:S-adenosylmethionine synthetase